MEDRDDDARFHHVYELRDVAKLLGLREGNVGRAGARHVTIVDLLSWARDPGGDELWYRIALSREPQHAWMARRGPLAPDSELGTLLWDLMRAIDRLPLRHQAVIALIAFGFSQREVAEILHVSKTEVGRVLWGEAQKDGAVVKVTASMNGKGST